MRKIYAHHFAGNEASGSVMPKIGMVHEGYLREHVKRRGQYIDLDIYGLLNADLVQPPLTMVEIQKKVK